MSLITSLVAAHHSKSENCKAAKAGPHSWELTDVVKANFSQTMQHKQVLLMMSKVQIFGRDGSTTQARALLDFASSMPLITQHLVQQLGVKRKRLYVSISGIGGNPRELSPQSTMDFRITSLKSGRRRIPLQAIVLGKVTSNLPLSPTPSIINANISRY